MIVGVEVRMFVVVPESVAEHVVIVVVEMLQAVVMCCVEIQVVVLVLVVVIVSRRRVFLQESRCRVVVACLSGSVVVWRLTRLRL